MIINILIPASFFIVLEYLAYYWLYPGEDFIFATIALLINFVVVLLMQLNINDVKERKKHTLIQYAIGILLVPVMKDTGSWGLALFFTVLFVLFFAIPFNVILYLKNGNVFGSKLTNIFKKVTICVAVLLIIFFFGLIIKMIF